MGTKSATLPKRPRTAHRNARCTSPTMEAGPVNSAASGSAGFNAVMTWKFVFSCCGVVGAVGLWCCACCRAMGL